ncbi:MAG: glycoside hydrolase family 31 protein [Rhodospirillales bacterium]
MAFSFQTADRFFADIESWVPVGAVTADRGDEDTFVLRLQDGPMTIRLSFCGPECLRVRFDPEGRDGGGDPSHAVVDRHLAPVTARVTETSPHRLVIDTGAIRVQVDLSPYRLSVYRNDQLVSADRPERNLVYNRGGHGIANYKLRPRGALFCGLGEKAGDTLVKNGWRLTDFNFDNFAYARAPVPPGCEGGPLDPAEPLYASIPFLIEINPAASGVSAASPFCSGLFFDNPSQSFFDLGGADAPPGTAIGCTTFGARFGAMDYYLILGDGVGDILRQFTQLTGRSAMPPRYVFGFHQGCYGYFDRARLEEVARGYRQARIPLDGLHIDIDLQDNYRVFTHSEMKFPDAAGMMAGLHADGFKCSTIVTPLITRNPLNQRGEMVPFVQRQDLLEAGCLLQDIRAGQQAPADRLFSAAVSYGANRGSNPYPYPPLIPNRDGVTPLGAEMNYPDLGRPEVREAWSRQYAHLIVDLGLDMIWQDMTCPAAAISADTPDGTLPLDLMTHDGSDYVPHVVCHNAYAQFLLAATHAALRTMRPDRRPFILARGGYAGLQRYAALWSGDNASSWDFLRISVPQALNVGLSGVPLAGSDVGGFATGPVPGGTTSASVVRDGRVIGGITDAELFVRWMQAGSFLPWFRNHYIGYDKEYQEPYAYGEPVAQICRQVIERRYRMLQVYYDAMYEWTQTGMPIVRALFLNDGDDPMVYRHLDDEFFVGRGVLVAPVLRPAADGIARRDIYLPAGHAWFPFAEPGAPLAPSLDGGSLLADVAVPLDAIPLYVRAGTILPLRSRIEQYVGELAHNPIDIHLYPGPDNTHLLYEDDGISTQADVEAAFRTTLISRRAVARGTTVSLKRVHDGYRPAEGYRLLSFLGSPAPASVRVAGAEVPAVASAAALDQAVDGAYFWDQGARAVRVKVLDRWPDVTATVTYPSIAPRG